jgi:heavy metal sensor kinase
MRTPFRTLRFRLTLWYALVLSLVLSAAGVLTYGLVRYQLVRHHDPALKDAAAEVGRVLSEREDCQRLTEAQRRELDRIGRVILFHELAGLGRVFYRSPDSSGVTAAIHLPTLDALQEARFETVPGPAGGLRVYSQPYRSRAGRPGLIHVVESLGEITEPLASLRLALLLMAPLAVLLSAASGYWLAGRALAPLDQVTSLARDLEASQLSRQLPVPKARDEIGRLVETFNQMIARLDASFEAMKRFTADASHELRGPLATMRGAIDVALDRPRDAEEYRRVLASVGEDVDRLRSIAEDLLILARADAGRVRIERQPVRLDIVAAELADSLAAANRQATLVEVRCTAPVVVLGDERWLRQLVFNLLDNALRFSTPGQDGSAQVAIEVTQDRDAARLEVTNSGPAIPPEALDHIFERFYRVDGSRPYRGAEGFGLGLSIASWIVEAHGGTIAARNRNEGGVAVEVTFRSHHG